MREPDMTPFETRLAGRLGAHSAIEVPDANALAIARTVMAANRVGFLPRWASLPTPVRAAIVLALISSLMVGAVLVGIQLVKDNPTVFLPSPSTPTATEDAPVGFAGEDLRARWLANLPVIPELGDGSGPVTLTIDSAGALLTVANIAPGMSFSSFTQLLSSGDLRLQLVAASGGCPAGSEGVYGLQRRSDGGQLTLIPRREECQTRRLALNRTWDRTLVAPTTIGAGMVDTFDPPFAVALPPGHYESRTLEDFIDIEATDTGFGFLVVKNPQGFADSCSPDQVRHPYTPGAAAFLDYYRQNDAFIVVEATPMTIDGHDAIHLVTNARVDGARCPGADLYAWTPKACECHFFGGDDNFYLVDVGGDTFLFQLALKDDFSVDLPIIESIRIPYSLGAPGT